MKSKYDALGDIKQWLNQDKLTPTLVNSYQSSLRANSPNHLVLDGLFAQGMLTELVRGLQASSRWAVQQHTYDQLYVDAEQWSNTSHDDRFVQRAIWQRLGLENTSDRQIPDITQITDRAQIPDSTQITQAILHTDNLAEEFLGYLRSPEFLRVISAIFQVELTDIHVAEPTLNTNFFRLAANDFIGVHADDSPGREVCMLLYLNQDWPTDAGGELVFQGISDAFVEIAPVFNRCVLFDPSSAGSEHLVNAMNQKYSGQYRYNVTSWYWSI